ncbi:hypothetical protein PC121_g13726 [Phytophthora cactorum]|nr:hypothetical protein PC120_g12996 [Phytophthora cactorum]KAG3059959.1 hypothetical protein PC121_g13726 [Phytophthora cactorum]KAG4052508.1 hypothetical protein PC123_g12309 [Phytophthora cactorum]
MNRMQRRLHYAFHGHPAMQYLSMCESQYGGSEDKGLGGMAAEKIRRKLVELEGETLGLELTLQIRALSFAWNAKCIFELIPISLDRVDIVEAKLRDVEEELARTKKRLADQNAEGVVYLAASSEIVDVVSDKEEIIWKDLISGHFELNSEQNGIIFLEGGWYIVNLMVHLYPQSSGGYVKSFKKYSCVLKYQAPRNIGKNTSTAMGWSGVLNKNDELSVIATKDPHKVGAELTVMRLSA